MPALTSCDTLSRIIARQRVCEIAKAASETKRQSHARIIQLRSSGSLGRVSFITGRHADISRTATHNGKGARGTPAVLGEGFSWVARQNALRERLNFDECWIPASIPFGRFRNALRWAIERKDGEDFIIGLKAEFAILSLQRLVLCTSTMRNRIGLTIA